jgi:hypothetical protein
LTHKLRLNEGSTCQFGSRGRQECSFIAEPRKTSSFNQSKKKKRAEKRKKIRMPVLDNSDLEQLTATFQRNIDQALWPIKQELQVLKSRQGKH